MPVQTLEELRAQIGTLIRANRARRELTTEREPLRLRYLAGIQLVDTTPKPPEFAMADTGALPKANGLPEYVLGEMTPGLLRAALLRDGCALARWLIEPGNAIRFAEGIERAYQEREWIESGQSVGEGCYEEFEPDSAIGRNGTRLGQAGRRPARCRFAAPQLRDDRAV